MEYHIALLIGRFQPFHKGHLYLVKKALQNAEKLVIGIGSASIYDENNPLDYETRRKIIKAVVYKEKIEDRVIKTVPLDDFFNDEKWLKNVKKQVGNFDLVVGNNEWTNKIMGKAGYPVKRFPYYKQFLYEGWRIRKLNKEGKKWQDRVPSYIIKWLENNLTIKKFDNVVLGGTFDHFHKGHQVFINKAFEIGKNVTIGIATEKLYQHKLLNKTIEPYLIRKKNLLTYVYNNFEHDRVKTRSFSEFTGGADKNKNIDAIVVSRLSYLNALKINKLREKSGLEQLRIVIVKDVLAEDGLLLSSERIRTGEIDRSGKCYELGVRRKVKKELILPEDLREELRKPLGKVFKTTQQIVGAIFKSPKKPTIIIAIGDIIVDSLLKNGIEPELKIIDFRSRRKPLSTTGPVSRFFPPVLASNNTPRLRAVGIPKRSTPVVNKPGTINLKTAKKLKELIQKAIFKKQKSWLVIDGEEDLLALPSILFAPLDSLVLYGHWQLGVIGVKVTEESKDMVLKIISKFD